MHLGIEESSDEDHSMAVEHQSPQGDRESSANISEAASKDHALANDFVHYVNPMNKLSDSEKFKALQDHFVPHEKYSFPIRVEYGKNRCFKLCWLKEHHWLVYSPSMDGAYCKACVLFGSETGDKNC